MQSSQSIIPLLIGLSGSILIHAAVLNQPGSGLETNARPQMQPGRTAVRLTLQPPAPAPEPKPVVHEKQPESPQQQLEPSVPVIEQAKPVPPPVEAPPEPAPQQPEPQPPQPDVLAAPKQAQGVTTDAHSRNEIHPEYPRISRVRGEQGQVIISATITVEGHARDVRILQSSGYQRLDRAAIKAFESAMFSPAMQQGKAVDSELKQTFTFRLTHD